MPVAYFHPWKSLQSSRIQNSRSGIFFHNLGDRVVAGLNVVAAAASMSRPDPDRKEMGRLASVPDKSFSSTILPVSCLNAPENKSISVI